MTAMSGITMSSLARAASRRPVDDDVQERRVLTECNGQFRHGLERRRLRGAGLDLADVALTATAPHGKLLLRPASFEPSLPHVLAVGHGLAGHGAPSCSPDVEPVVRRIGATTNNIPAA